jgi:dTDP-4-amino-4,6-dideoxygalactose transaminase
MGHTLQAGEMGVVTTDNSELYEQLKTVKDQGRLFRSHRTSSNWFNSEQIGFNFKTTEINATIALAQLKKVDSIIRLRRRNARLMSELLVKWDGILQLPNFPSDVCPFAYPILIQSEMISRDIICADIEGMGVETRIMFPCVPIVQPAYKNLQELYRGQLPNSERLGKQAFYVGCHQYMSEEEVSDVAQIIGHALENALAQERSNE